MHHNIRPFAKDWWDALPYYGGAFFLPFCREWDSAFVTFPKAKISCNRNRQEARVGHKRNKNQGFLIPATD
jgi:hypothetical protein